MSMITGIYSNAMCLRSEKDPPLHRSSVRLKWSCSRNAIYIHVRVYTTQRSPILAEQPLKACTWPQDAPASLHLLKKYIHMPHNTLRHHSKTPPPTDHLQSSSDDAADDIRVEQVWMVLGQLDKLGQRVLVKHKRELVVLLVPAGHRGNHTNESLKTDLHNCQKDTGISTARYVLKVSRFRPHCSSNHKHGALPIIILQSAKYVVVSVG